MTRSAITKRIITTTALYVLAVACFICQAQSVAPLLGEMSRHQRAPYNTYCPLYDGSMPCDVGCVATAAESIITYYGQDITLSEALPGWKTEHYIVPEVPDGSHLTCSKEDPDAIARLSFWLGVACHMNWTPSGSGANINRLVEPLQQSFGWKYVRYLHSDDYTPENWRSIIIEELEHGRPILYAGYTCHLGGHAFVIDGVREDGLFHINWGYGGNYDSNWYELAELVAVNPTYDRRPEDCLEGFSINQEMLLLHYDEQNNPFTELSLERTGKEIEVSAALPASGLYAKQYCPIEISLYNTAETPLTTSFEILSNASDQTEELFEKGDYGALFSATLNPGERTSFSLPVQFEEAGLRILRISCDDETFRWESGIVTIHPEAKSALTFKEPEIKVTDTQASISVDVNNGAETPAGSILTYCLTEGETFSPTTDGDTRHYAYIYTPGHSQEQFHVDFKGLQPNTFYTLLLRHPWLPVFEDGHTFRAQEGEANISLPQYLPQQNLPTHIIYLGPTKLQITDRKKTLLY